jgi:hypothetical protein
VAAPCILFCATTSFALSPSTHPLWTLLPIPLCPLYSTATALKRSRHRCGSFYVIPDRYTRCIAGPVNGACMRVESDTTGCMQTAAVARVKTNTACIYIHQHRASARTFCALTLSKAQTRRRVLPRVTVHARQKTGKMYRTIQALIYLRCQEYFSFLQQRLINGCTVAVYLPDKTLDTFCT